MRTIASLREDAVASSAPSTVSAEKDPPAHRSPSVSARTTSASAPSQLLRRRGKGQETHRLRRRPHLPLAPPLRRRKSSAIDRIPSPRVGSALSMHFFTGNMLPGVLSTISAGQTATMTAPQQVSHHREPRSPDSLHGPNCHPHDPAPRTSLCIAVKAGPTAKRNNRKPRPTHTVTTIGCTALLGRQAPLTHSSKVGHS